MVKTAPEVEASSEATLDGFLDNGIVVIQPARGAHRAGLDAVLLAATVPQSFTGTLCDLGAGCGVAGLAVLHRTRAHKALLVERDPVTAAMARNSLTLFVNGHVGDRAKVLEADITLSGTARQAAGLWDNGFDHVITNPPYNGADLQRSPREGKAQAHTATPGLFDAWFRTACAILKPGGRLSTILRPQDIQPLLSALDGRFGSIRILPLHPRADSNASRILLGATRGGKAPLALLPPLVLHAPDGAFTPGVDAALRGRCGVLLWPS